MKFSSLKPGQRFRAYSLAGVWVKTAAYQARRERGRSACFDFCPAILVAPL